MTQPSGAGASLPPAGASGKMKSVWLPLRRESANSIGDPPGAWREMPRASNKQAMMIFSCARQISH